MLTSIAITKLHPHLQNPRKELGDITELAESIKVRGVLQNLTVVPKDFVFEKHASVGKSEMLEEPVDVTYTVIIGHRRLAAAKLAGLTELPCVIVDMDPKTQIATMLLENIQRSDLTTYEQAQGFQMMLDLGDTMDAISSKTGFSTSTVRRRVKLLELDKDKFKKSETRGATLFDYMELDKIKSIDRKNDVLEHIGTENFRYKLKQAIDAEVAEERIAKWIEALSAFATQVDSDSGYAYVGYYSTYNEPNIERPSDADTVEYFFSIEKYGGIRLLKKHVVGAKKEDAVEVKRREHEKWLRGQLEATSKRAYELRKEFADAVSTTCIKKHLADILAFDLWVKLERYSDLGEDEVLDMLGIELHEGAEDGEEDKELTYDMILAAVASAPEKALWRMAYYEMDDDAGVNYITNWNLQHCENDCLDRLYALLVKMGYQMSDEEKALKDGTHRLFTDVGPEDSEEES